MEQLKYSFNRPVLITICYLRATELPRILIAVGPEKIQQKKKTTEPIVASEMGEFICEINCRTTN